ncbi:hypothetical protein Ahy_B08g093149 [Arachis hypogaea]|uniref:Transposase MuDR plant domain-containing protein n=1 Tax=Arachis hypogaea TaxID=3818 RepID=A0A444Y5E8_ARAHY|nr:hypothetical protein Ahy_B08g093149 [Arachis hypogaea]
MTMNPLLSTHYDGKIVYDEKGSIVFRSGQPIITYMKPKVNNLTALKNLILYSVGKQQTKMVKKIYYRYPTEVDDRLFYKRYRLRDDEDVRLIRSWHIRWTNAHLLELFVFFVELGGRGSSTDTINDSPLSGAIRRNIRRTMVDLNMQPEGSQEGSNVEVCNADMMDDDVESHEGYAIRDPMMNQLNLDAMTLDWSFTQGGSEDDPSNKFEVGQQFQNKKEVMLAVKRYNIRRGAEYKIIESDQLRYNVQCIQFGPGCSWSILISYRLNGSKSASGFCKEVWRITSVTRRPTEMFGSTAMPAQLSPRITCHICQGPLGGGAS